MREIPKIPGLTPRQLQKLKRAAIQESGKPPRIALIGECGVGKSTTINALFNAGVPTNHVTACTQESIKLHVEVSQQRGTKGEVKIYDMPGLGEDEEADKKHVRTYHDVLEQCDVAVWILDGTTRQFSHTQLALRSVVKTAMGNLDRLVIGINKIDQIRPGKWNPDYNLPSIEQELSIEVKIKDALDKVGRVCFMDRERVVPYSAEMWYRLPDLLGAMLDACPTTRGWVLYDRADLGDFKTKVLSTILKDVGG